MEESVSLEMDNHVLDKEDGCYDNTEATFSDDEEELNNKGENPRVPVNKPLRFIHKLCVCDTPYFTHLIL